MSYVDQQNGPSAAGLASSIIVQAAIGATVIAGLTVSQFETPEAPKPMDPIDYPLDPPPPPPPPEKQEVVPEEPVLQKPYVPPRNLDFKIEQPKIDYTEIMPDPLPPIPQPGITPKADPEPLAPVAT